MGRTTDEFLGWLQSAVGDGERPAIPAATVVVLRDGPDGVETLLMRKTSKIAFGGMWVFPGGRIDDEDRHPERPDDDVTAARRAAVREAQEEAGLVVEEHRLQPWSFWLPPPQTPKRFATWFFLGPAPDHEVQIDGGEIEEHRWAEPGALLAARDAGEVELAPPTWVTLHQIDQYASVEDALSAAADRTPERFVTRIGRIGEEIAALWHGDAGYETGDATQPGARHRLVMSNERWRYERAG